MKPSQDSYVPSFPDQFVVDFGNGKFGSSLRAQKGYKAGETLVLLKGLSKGPKAYTSVQCGLSPDDHIELNSDLVYVNHSCEPNVVFDLSADDMFDWHVQAMTSIEVGTVLTFFYPSTEWEMDQSFDCECGAETCLKHIRGAAYLSQAQLKDRGFINSFIWEMIYRRDGLKSKDNVSVCVSCNWGLSMSDSQRCGCKPIIC